MTTDHVRPTRRRLLATGLGLAAGTAAGAFAATAPAAASEYAVLRVGTYNIHHAAGSDGVLDLDRIAGVIAEQDLDIVGLQEVDRYWSARSEWLDQPAELAARLGMRSVYGANLDLDPPAEGAPRRQYGTAVLSRWPILHWSNTLLPRYPDHEQRGLLTAVVEAHGARIHFANTHLQHNNAAERLEQAHAILDVLGGDPRRTILTGDLNAEADKPEIRALTGVLDDSWTEVGDGPGHTYSAEDPHARIDFVLGSPDLTPLSATVGTRYAPASDHLPVIVEYRIRKGVL